MTDSPPSPPDAAEDPAPGGPRSPGLWPLSAAELAEILHSAGSSNDSSAAPSAPAITPLPTTPSSPTITPLPTTHGAAQSPQITPLPATLSTLDAPTITPLRTTLHGAPDAVGRRILTDSRAGIRPGDVFIGLIGPRFDGGRFAAAALEGGASIAITGAAPLTADAATRSTGSPAASSPLPLRPGQAHLVVSDPLAALHALAAAARRRFAGRLLAITGSNGKTTVKDMLVAILGGPRRLAASPQSYNSQVGVALSLLEMDPGAELAIVECGISEPSEMERLEAMVRPDCGILVNVGDAHLEGLGSQQVTAHEKAQLFRRLPADGWVWLPAAETLARRALAALPAPPPQRLLVQPFDPEPATTLTPPTATLLPGDPTRLLHRRPGDGTEHPTRETLAPLPLTPASPQLLEDAALAAAAALDLGATPDDIQAGLAAWHPAPMRLEITTTPRGVLLINDAYTADPASVEGALWALARETSPGAARAVLAGMDQLGPARAAAHRQVGRRVHELGIDTLLGVGPGGAEIVAAARAAGLAPEAAVAVADVDEAAQWLEERCRPGDRVLLKGSRSARLERVAARLLDAGAPARLTVDLDQLTENFHHLRAFVQPPSLPTPPSPLHTTEAIALMAVVKSFGYGLDAVRLAHALQHAGADAFAVAYVDEGVHLRRRGVTDPILVQNPIQAEAEKLVRHGLSAEVSDPRQIPWLSAEGRRQRRAVRTHLKIDTGMGRAGVLPPDALPTARALAQDDWLLLEGVMTHFAAADDPAHDAFTTQQIARFDQVLAALATASLTPRWIHAANSAALARFPAARYTLVRTGLALLGYSAAANHALAAAGSASPASPPPALLRPVLRLTTEIISVKQLPPDHPAGYGLTWRTPDHPRRLALVALGYTDGYPWALSNRGAMTIRGVLCPVVGRISMDVTLLDVTALDPPAQPGEEVVCFGPGGDDGAPEPDLLEMAERAGTIPYELLTRIGPRVRRVFRTRY